MPDRINLLKSQLGDHRIKLDFDLSKELQSGLGGKVAAYYIATTSRELILCVSLCRELNIEYLVIGSGSKVAISDNGFRGLIIKNRADNLKIFGIKGKVSREGLGIEEAFIEAESGVSLSRLSDFAALQKLSGLEIFKTSLGTVGGSVFFDPTLRGKSNQIKVLTSNDNVITKEPGELLKDDLIISVTFKLKSKKF